MRVVAAWILAMGLIALPLMAGTNSGDDHSSSAARSDTDNGTAKSNTTGTPAATEKVSTPANADKTESTTKAESGKKTESASMEAELEQLRDLLEMQAKQLQQQNQQLQEQQKKMQLLEEQLNAATPGRAGANASASTPAPAAGIAPAASASSSDVTTKTMANSAVNSGSGASGPAPPSNSDEPVAIHYKGITLTPGGFTAAETSWRSKALSADVNTPFNSVPMPGASNSNVSEFNLTGRQSRISMLFEGKLSGVKIGGYYEGDFLGGGSTSNNNQTNSYVFRQRQFWGQAAFDNGWTITGGQQWSLVTQTAHGMDNRTEVLPLTIDAQYHIGFSWARQYGMRFTKNFGNKFWLGFSIENPQTTFTVHGNPTATVTTGATTVDCPISSSCPTGTTTVGGTSTTYVNFLLGATGTSGGLFNPLANYSYNPAPDLVFKAVAEPANWAHFELVGLYARFRDRIFPCQTLAATATCPVNGSTGPSAVGASEDSTNGGGIGGNMMLNLFAKHLDFGLHAFGGNGVGRYGSGGLSDATIRPDGSMALLKNYQALGTIVLHPVPKLDIYMNAGGEYASRAQFFKTATATTPNEGYGAIGFSNAGCYTEIGPTTTVPAGTTGSQGYIPGSLANCTSDTRDLVQGTLGFWYRFYQGPKGRMQYGMQYSYYVRNTWRGTPPGTGSIGAGDGAPHADENMWFTSLRYYLP
jgi:FKBP-type peptidyl-prolyl cis-trans isomerase